MALKLCPHLTLLPGRMAAYKEASQYIREIFARYTLLIELLSLDEAYLDVTDSLQCNGSLSLIAQQIRQAIVDELNLTASPGIAPIKFLAKIASELNKPNGQYVITPAQVPGFLQQLPLSKLPGVGKVTAKRLEEVGLITCADVQQYDHGAAAKTLRQVRPGSVGTLSGHRPARGILTAAAQIGGGGMHAGRGYPRLAGLRSANCR